MNKTILIIEKTRAFFQVGTLRILHLIVKVALVLIYFFLDFLINHIE